MQTAPAVGSGERARVLIVDDDEVIKGSVRQRLTEGGFSVDVATNGSSAEDHLRRRNYEVVLMDAYLTGHLGPRAIELVDRVRLLAPNAHIIVLTAYSSPRLAAQLQHHRRLTIVSKPKSVAFVGELIEGLLSQSTE